MHQKLLQNAFNFEQPATPGKVHCCSPVFTVWHLVALAVVCWSPKASKMTLQPFPDWEISVTFFLTCSEIYLDLAMMSNFCRYLSWEKLKQDIRKYDVETLIVKKILVQHDKINKVVIKFLKETALYLYLNIYIRI